MKWYIAVTSVVLFIPLVVVSTAGAQSTNAVVRLTPAVIEANAGDAVEILVEIEGATNLAAFQFDLSYDSLIAKIDQIELGEFPSSSGRSVSPLGPILEPGKVMFGAFSFGDGEGPAGSGTLAIISLTALAGGTSALDLQNVQVVDIDGSRMPVSIEGGEAHFLGDPPVEEPTTSPSVAEAVGAASATPNTLIVPTQENEPSNETPSVASDWLIVVAVLLGLIATVTLAAYRMSQATHTE